MKESILLLTLLPVFMFMQSCKKDEENKNNTTNTGGNNNATNCINYAGNVSDINGNIYKTVQIGNQTWMASNLRTNKYRNGDPITTGLNNTQWSTSTVGLYCYYNDDANKDIIYGKLYNWYAVVDSRGLCPVGWHTPSDGEWNQLVKSIDSLADTTIMFNQSLIAGGDMKAPGTIQDTGFWEFPNVGATNNSCFTALPGGVKSFPGGSFANINKDAYWWSSVSVPAPTNAWFRTIQNESSDIDRNTTDRRNALSVRCVLD